MVDWLDSHSIPSYCWISDMPSFKGAFYYRLQSLPMQDTLLLSFSRTTMYNMPFTVSRVKKKKNCSVGMACFEQLCC